jgi:hypothetical protein
MNAKEQHVQVDLNFTKEINCPVCQGNIFAPVYFLRECPGILLPHGKPETLPVPAFMCANCRHVMGSPIRQGNPLAKIEKLARAFLEKIRK